jgi:hypothetical protein
MILVTLVLWLLAAYHIVMGAVALFAPQFAPMLVRSLYGASVTPNAHLRYMTSMIGALALAIGGLAAVAAQRPYDNRPIIAALLVLQLCRAFCRVRDRRVLADSFNVSGRANSVAIALLGIQSIILGFGLR